MFRTPLARRRWRNFRSNRRAYWSLWIFGFLFITCLFAEFVANDRPLLVSYRGDFFFPAFQFHAETDFGGEFETEAEYPSSEVQCLIRTGGIEACLDDPEGTLIDAEDGFVGGNTVEAGWILWPPIPYSFNTINYDVQTAPSPPDENHILGTDDQTRDVVARISLRVPHLDAVCPCGRGGFPRSPASSPGHRWVISADGWICCSSGLSRSGRTSRASTSSSLSPRSSR